MAKRAFITGITGQDGAYLAKFLLDKGYEVFGSHRKLSTPNFWRLQYLNILEEINLVPTDLTDSSSIFDAIRHCQPDEIYHLAAPSFVGVPFEHTVSSGEVIGLGATRLLEAISEINTKIKFYQASTIELYGEGGTKPLTEDTAFKPVNPYAAAKLYGYWIARIYRDGYGMFACNGILFNHESPLRSLDFVTRKISNAAAKISLGLEKELRLGNLDAKRDWGYAPEFVRSMWLMLQQEKPDDYIIATNETHTVREFAEKAFKTVELDWQKHVKTDEKLLRPTDINFRQGDYSKAREKLGWQPEVKFDQLAEIMAKEDVNRWERWLNGERFPWDVLNYPSENSILSRMTRD